MKPARPRILDFRGFDTSVDGEGLPALVGRNDSERSMPTVARAPWRRVVACYSAFDRFFPICGFFDLTEGIYHGNPDTPYEQAQLAQHDYLLDQIGCESGRRVLDLGCGYGTLLERARRRGAAGVGITVSPEQARYCRRKGLDVRLLDYRAIPEAWARSFDGVVANGSIEHFVRPDDAAAGRADQVYERLFRAVHRVIDPDPLARRFATTTIHFMRKPADPRDLKRSPLRFRWGSDDFHRAVLECGWGGYYPTLGQLQRCAAGYFDLVEEVDGTEDYRLTSEVWLRRTRQALRSRRAISVVLRSAPLLVRAPREFLTLVLGALLTESWNWQFRTPDPPMRLLRQTWAYRARA